MLFSRNIGHLAPNLPVHPVCPCASIAVHFPPEARPWVARSAPAAPSSRAPADSPSRARPPRCCAAKACSQAAPVGAGASNWQRVIALGADTSRHHPPCARKRPSNPSGHLGPERRAVHGRSFQLVIVAAPLMRCEENCDWKAAFRPRWDWVSTGGQKPSSPCHCPLQVRPALPETASWCTPCHTSGHLRRTAGCHCNAGAVKLGIPSVAFTGKTLWLGRVPKEG